MQESGETLSIEELTDLGHWVENTLAPSSELRIVHSHPTAFRPLGRTFTKSDCRCAIFGIIGVLGNRKYALCGIGETVPDPGLRSRGNGQNRGLSPETMRAAPLSEASERKRLSNRSALRPIDILEFLELYKGPG